MSKLKGSSEILAKGGFRVSRRELLKASSSIGRTKTLTSHLFTPLFMFIHLPLIHFAPPPRSLIDFKNSKWPIFCILLCICCFSHLIGLLSVTWLSLLYKFTRFFIYFLFLSDEAPMLETLDYILSILAVQRPFYIIFEKYFQPVLSKSDPGW